MADNFRTQKAHDEEMRKFDPYVHAVTVIQEEHRLIHDGFYFSASGITLNVASGANLDLLIKMPAGSIGHLVLVEYALEDTPVDITFYEDVTVSADGTPVNIRNHNRVVANDTSGASMYEGPTITDLGTKLYERYIPNQGIGASGGATLVAGGDREWVIGHPTEAKTYVWRLTNNSGGIIDTSYHLSGYEIGYEE